MKLLHWNVQGPRFDYGKTWTKRRPKIVDQIKVVRPDVATIVECIGVAEGLAIDSGLVVDSFQGSAVMWNPATVRFSRILFQAVWLGKTHGVIAVELVERATGERFNVIAGHLPPFAWRAKLRKRLIDDLTKRTAKWRDQTIVGLDANWGKGFEAYVYGHGRWFSALDTAPFGTGQHPSYRTSGKWGKGQPIDYVIARPLPLFSEYRIVNAHGASDHHPVIVWL